MDYKCGYIAILGKPNAGKSTLVNCMVGEKVAIVSSKPQTTRNNILGILTKSNYQLIFVDTPGIHKSKNALDKFMMKNVRSAISGASVNIYLIDSTKEITGEEIDYVKNIKQKNEVPLIVCLSKTDLVKKQELLIKLSQIANINEVDEVVPISSYKAYNTNELLEIILKYLPNEKEKNFIYDDDYYTDKSINFIVAETIREKALLCLEQEIPHGINVNIVSFIEKPNITVIEADIVCERESHKSIIIGKRGKKLKEIGEKARIDIEKLLDKKVLLKLFVKTKKNWRDSENYLKEFGYKKENL